MIRRLLLPLLCLSFCSPVNRSLADEPRFQVLPSTTDFGEGGRVKSYVLITDTTRFNFIPPATMTLEVEKEARKIKLTAADRKCFISLQLTTTDPSLLKQPGQAVLHDLVQEQFINAPVAQALLCYTGAGPGCSFDVEQTTAAKARLTTRVAFMPCSEGLVEICMTTASTNFNAQCKQFAGLLGSLRLEAAPPNALKRNQPARSQEAGR